jgi:hypothetical protein
MDVEGLGVGKDFKLYPGGGRVWDWTETGTEHVPGIQPADVEELPAHSATTVVMSRGMDRRLQIHPRTLKMLEDRSAAVHVIPTADAVEIYNDLIDDVNAGELFHSTC